MNQLENKPLLFVVGVLLLFGSILTIASKSLFLPIVIFVGIFGISAFFYAPREVFFLVLFIRVQLDVFWWIPVSIGPLNLLAVFTGGITVLGTILAVMRFSGDIEKHPCIQYFLGLCFLLIFSATRAYNTTIMIDEFFRMYSPILIIFLVTSLFNKRGDWKRVFFLFFIASLLPIFLSTYHLLTGQMNQIELDGVNRLYGGYHNLRNHALMMFIFSACGVYFLFQSQKRSEKIFFGLYCSMTLTYLYLTHTRATLIIFGVFVLIFLSLTQRRSWMLGLVFLFSIAVITNPSLLQRFSELSRLFLFFGEQSPQEIDFSSLGSGRFGLWSNSMEAYLDHSVPEVLLGLGFGYHWILTRGAYNGFVLVQGGFVDTHNDMLRVLYQIGPFGLLLFLLMIYQIVKTSQWIRKNAPQKQMRDAGAILIALCIAIVINNILSNGINSRTTFGWCFWALGGIAFIAKREVLNDMKQQAKVSKESIKAKTTSISNTMYTLELV